MSMQSDCNKNDEVPITVPLWQMMHREKEDGEEEEKNEKFNCLTSRVRACYLKNLEKVLLTNYEQCSKEEHSAFLISREYITKIAEQLEFKALRSCMVVILYQRAMMRLTTDIKKHTQQLKLYRRLQEFINSNSGWQDKEIQTARESFLIDGTTQTDDIDTAIIKAEPPECSEGTKTRALCIEAQPIPVLVSGVAISKPLPERSTQQCNIFQSTSLQITYHNKNVTPKIAEKDKAYYKRNAKNLSSSEPKTNSPPKRLCLRVKHLSSLQTPAAVNGVIPPLPMGPLPEVVDHHIRNMSMSQKKQEIMDAVPDIPLPPSPPPSAPAIQDSNEPSTDDTIEIKPSFLFDQAPVDPCTSAVPPSIINDQPPSPASSNGAKEQNQPEEDSCSSPRMSIEERLALVFNIPSETPCTSSPSQNKQNGNSDAVKSQRRMSIEERLEAVFRGETINDEDVQLEDDNQSEQGNGSMETIIKCEAVPQKLVAPAHVKLRFIELFGHETDGEVEDNDPPYKDKIARWVVECLMPYYRHKVIASRPLFKKLARHIADTVMLSKPLPDKSDVEDCVTEFFSNHSCVFSERDIY